MTTLDDIQQAAEGARLNCVCGGSGRAQHRGFTTACEHCAYREMVALRSRIAELEAALSAANARREEVTRAALEMCDALPRDASCVVEFKDALAATENS